MVMGEGKRQNFKHNHHHHWDAMKELDEHEQQQQQQQHHHPCSSIEEASSTITNGSSSYDDDDDDDDTCSSSSSFDIVDDDDDDVSCSSANSSRSSLYDLSDLMSHLPIKRGLSKFYHGKSDSFTSLARVKSIDDLPKKEKNNPKSTTFRSHTLPKPIISKKNSRKKKFPSSKTHKHLHE